MASRFVWRTFFLRRFAFYLHLWIGLILGSLLLAVGLSGALLVYAPEFENGIAPAGKVRGQLPLGAAVAIVRAAYPGWELRHALFDEFGNANAFHLASPAGGRLEVHLHPVTGRVVHSAAQNVGVWRWLRELHHNLLAGKIGRKVNGLLGAALLLLVLTGALLWWPGAARWRERLRLQPGVRWKRRTWDLHTVLGVWLALPIAFFAFTGFQFAFPETADGLIRAVTGAVKPAPQPKPKAWPLVQGERAPLEQFLARAEQAIPGGRAAQLRFPHKGGEAVEVRVKTPGDLHWRGHSRVWLHPVTAEVLRTEDFRHLQFGNKMALAFRQLHQGHFTAPGGWGTVLRILWIPVGILPGFLFLTGFLMWWNRVLSKRFRAVAPGPPRAARAAAVLAILCLAPAQAQEALLTGQVLDGSGAAVVRAKVSLRTNPERVAFTSAEGVFRFQQVPPGTYVLLVESPGFTPAVLAARPGTPVAVRLEPAPYVQTVEVNAGTFDQIRLDEPVFQTGIVRSDIATRNNRRLSDVVARMPGVFMSGPPGGDKDVRLRGMDKEFSRTQVDGFQIPDGGEKRELQLNRIPSSIVESVRIIRNPTAEFESDGLAGRVEVQTRPLFESRRVDGRIGIGARQSGGNHRLTQGQITAGQRFRRNFGFTGTFDWLDDILPISRRFVNPNGDIETDNELQPQRSPNFYGNFGVATERFGDLFIKPLYLHFTSDKQRLREVTNAAGRLTRREAETETKRQETFGLTMHHRYARASGFLLDTQAGWFGSGERKPRSKEIFRILPDGSYTPDRTERNPESKGDRTWNLNAAASLPVRALFWQEWKFGASLRSRGRTRDRHSFIIRPNGTLAVGGDAKDRYRIAEHYSAGFIQNRIRITDRFSWTPGVRVERVHLLPQSGFLAAPPRVLVDVNPSLHLLFRASNNLSLRAAVSRGLARPKFDELAPYEVITATKIVTGNPGLEPARAWNYDAGIDYATRLITLSVNGFQKQVRGFIEEVATGEFREGRDVFQVQNSGNGWTRGIEFEQRVRLPQFFPVWARRFSFWANQTLLDSELVDRLGQRRRFKEQPRWVANFGGDFTDEKLGVSLAVMANAVSRRFDFKTNGDVTSFGGSTSIDVALYQRLRGPLRLFVEGNNLANHDRNRDEIFARGGVQRRTEVFGRTVLAGVEVAF